MVDWRYWVQDAVTKEFLDTNAVLEDPELTYTLSGTGVLRATVGPVVDFDSLFREWGTIITPERNGRPRSSFIPVTAKFDNEAGKANIECISLAGYPVGIPFEGVYREWAADPFDMYRLLWDHVQSYENGDLNVTVDQHKSNKRVGSYQPPPKPVRPRRSAYGSKAKFDAAKSQWDEDVREWEESYGDFRPYELLWWEKPDCGEEMNRLASESRFDYIEEHDWNEDKSDFTHHIRLGDPRFGRRRNDLRFMEGENLHALPSPQREGDRFANYVLALGKGEGRKMRRSMVGRPDGRLRRVAVVSHKGVSRVSTLRARAERAWSQRRNTVAIESFAVSDSKNARIGAWNLGDEVLVQSRSGLQPVEKWCRIVEWTEKPQDGDVAIIKVAK